VGVSLAQGGLFSSNLMYKSYEQTWRVIFQASAQLNSPVKNNNKDDGLSRSYKNRDFHFHFTALLIAVDICSCAPSSTASFL
jgi:hypothetical protein